MTRLKGGVTPHTINVGPFAVTEMERDVLNAILDKGGNKAAAAALDIPELCVGDAVRRVRARNGSKHRLELLIQWHNNTIGKE